MGCSGTDKPQQQQALHPPSPPPSAPLNNALHGGGSASLEDLLARANACTQPTVLNLHGARFSAKANQVLTLLRDGLTLQNGHLDLTGKQRLFITGSSTCFEHINVSGPSVAAASYEPDWGLPKGLVHVTGGGAVAGGTTPGAWGSAHLRLFKCTLCGGGATDAVVAVDMGCSVELASSVVRGHPKGVGLCVAGVGSSARAADCVFQDSYDSGVYVVNGGRVELSSCQLSGSRAGKGLEVGRQGGAGVLGV